MLIAAAAAVNVRHTEADRLARGEPALDWDNPIAVAAARVKNNMPIGEAFLFSGQYLPQLLAAGITVEQLKPYWYGYFRSVYEQYGTGHGDRQDAAATIGRMLALCTVEPGVPTDVFDVIIKGREVALRHYEEELARKDGGRAGTQVSAMEDDL